MDNCIVVTSQLLKYLKVKFTRNFIEEQLLSHPDHPSLLSISDVLTKYNIENIAIKTDIAKLQSVPLPVLVQFNDHGGVFYLVLSISEKEIVYLDSNDKKTIIQRVDFESKWTGICLFFQPNEKSGEPDIQKKLEERNINISLIAIAIALILISTLFGLNYSSLFTKSQTFYFVLYIISKLLGLVMGVFLLWFEIDKYNPALQRICSGGKKVNCEAVLNSKYAKIFGERLSLGLLCFSYFFGTITFLVFEGANLSSLYLLSYLSIAAIPVIFISAYFQGFVIKQWCKICLVVLLVLMAEASSVILGNLGFKRTIDWITIPMLLGLILLPIPIWYNLKKLFKKSKESRLFKRSLKKIKNNRDVLESLLEKSKDIVNSAEGLGITIKNENAQINIIKVCNPYCGPCAKAHSLLEKLISSKKINLQILFMVPKDVNDLRTKAAGHLMAIDAIGNQETTIRALDDWYLSETKDYDSFASNYPLDDQLSEQHKNILLMRKWCDTIGIRHTPTIFLNGKEFPNEYNIEDLAELLN